MKATIRTLMGLGFVALLAAPAFAQGRGVFGRGSLAFLLGNESVQKELKLDDAQVDRAKVLAEKTAEQMREKFQDMQGLEGQERGAKMTEIIREANASTLKAASEFLKPEQLTRLKQVSYQTQGITAFSDPEVTKKLGLTDSQKSDIQEIGREMREKQPTLEELQSDREAAMTKMRERNKESLAKAESKLNDEQKKKWKELIGPAFEWPPRR